jgi:hypothetical protein
MAPRGGLFLLLVVLGLHLLLLLDYWSSLLSDSRWCGHSGKIRDMTLLICQPLPDLRHLYQDGPPLPDWKGVSDLQAFAREASVTRTGRLFRIVRHVYAISDQAGSENGGIIQSRPDLPI